MKWRAAVIDGQLFDLTHLHPFTFSLHLDALSEMPAITFEIDVTFGLHCFTEELKEEHSATYHYADMREIRAFNMERYELSRKLPEIIQDLDRRRCYEAQHNNYMTFEIIRNGMAVQYQIYFKVTQKRDVEGRLHLFVQSAFPKDQPKKVQREKPRLFKTICVQAAGIKK